MKKLFLIMLLQFAACALVAQQHEPVNPQTDIEVYEGYTIKLLPAQGGTYGYDIFDGQTLVVYSEMNLFTIEPTGPIEKLDTYINNPYELLGQTLTEPEWVLHSTIDGVQLHYKISICSDNSVVYLMLVNTTEKKVKVSWNEEYWTSEFHIPESTEGIKEIEISPNTTVEGLCQQNGTNPLLEIPINYIISVPDSKFTKFNYHNIRVSTVI